MAESNLTAQRLRELLDYNPLTGGFTWTKPTSNRVKAGDGLREISTWGYWMVTIDGKTYGAHRLAWFYVHGEWPKQDIDHINGDRKDNRITNLRDVSKRVNQENRRKANINSRSGLLGAWFHRTSGLWHSRITTNGVSYSLGYFRDKNDAHQAYLTAKRRRHEGCTI